MWAIDQIVVACLAAIGIFTTTFSIIEPRPLLAISHQAHAIVNPIWYSFQRLETPLELSYKIGLHDNNTTGVPHPVEGYISDLHQPVDNCTSDSPHIVNGLLLLSSQDDLSAADSYNELVFTEQQPIYDDHFMLQYLLGAFGWTCRHQVFLVVVLCLAALCFVLLVPITVPQKFPVCNRIATSTQGLDDCLGSTPLEFAVPVEQAYESVSVLNFSLYLQNVNLEQELEAFKASKQDLQIELELMKEENANLQKEIAKTTDYNAEMQARSREHIQKIKTLESHLEVKNEDAEELAAKVTSLSRDLTVQKQLLKVKAEECNDMEEETTAQFECNQSLKRELEATKASKEDMHAELMSLRQNSVTLQKEIASSREHNARVQAKSTEHGREMEALKCHIESKNEDAAELTAKLARVSSDLTVQKQLLKVKAEECNDMEEKATAWFESNQSLKRELEGTKVQLSKNLELLKSVEQNYAELKQQESSTKQALSTAQNENVALNASLTAKSDKLCKKIALCKSTEQKCAKLKECETAIKDELECAQSQNRELLVSLTAKSEELCKCKEEVQAEHEGKVEIEKQLAALCKEKGEVSDCLAAASRDYSKAKELLSQAHEKEKIAIFEISFKDNARNFIHHKFTQYRADHQAQMNEWMATQSSLLLQADQSLRLRKAAEAEAAEAKHALLKLQADRANAFTTIAMISKRRSGSGQSTSITPPSQSSTPTSTDTKDKTENEPIPDHRPRTRHGRLMRQLRRPSKAARLAKSQAQEKTISSSNTEMRILMHVSLNIPSVRLHLPFGRHLITAKSMLDVTIWRLNDAALIGFHCSPNTLRDSMVHFWCDISQLRSVSAARYQLYCLRQSAQMLFSNARMASLHIPASLKAVSGAISQAKTISPPPPRITHAKASAWQTPATTPNESGYPIVVAAAEEKRSAPKAKPEGQLSSSIWAAPIAPKAHTHSVVVEAAKEKRPAAKAEPKGQLSSSIWAATVAPKAPKVPVLPNVIEAAEEKRPAAEAEPTKQLISLPVTQKASIQPVRAVAPKEQSPAPKAQHTKPLSSSIWAPVAAEASMKPVNIVASVETHLLRETRPDNQLASSIWANNTASQSAQVAPEEVIEPVNVVTPGEQDATPQAQASKDLANSRWAQPVLKPQAAPKHEIPCKHFAKGRCRKGRACPYKHDAK